MPCKAQCNESISLLSVHPAQPKLHSLNQTAEKFPDVHTATASLNLFTPKTFEVADVILDSRHGGIFDIYSDLSPRCPADLLKAKSETFQLRAFKHLCLLGGSDGEDKV